jgi:hypothetical protein
MIDTDCNELNTPDTKTAFDCLNRLVQPDTQLPLIDPLLLPRSDARCLVRAKLTSRDTPQRKAPRYRPYQKGAKAEGGMGLGLGLGLTCSRLFKNDVIPYPGTQSI